MKISGFSPLRNSSGVKRRSGSTDSASFSEYLSETDAKAGTGAETVSDTVAIGSLDVLLSLQEAAEDGHKRRQTIEQGTLTLDTLEQLRHALLLGEIPLSLLNRLQQRLKAQKQSADPQLRAIIDEIELRAAVEAAKLEMATSAASSKVEA